MLYLEENELPVIKKALFRSAMLVELSNDEDFEHKEVVKKVLDYIDSSYELFIEEQEKERICEDVEIF